MKGHLKKAQKGLKPGEFTWRIVLSLGKGPTGAYRQKWVTFYGTKRQAEAKQAELVDQVHKGKYIEGSTITVAEWLDRWLEKAIKPPLRTKYTYNSYKSVVMNHLKPVLGHIVLQKLTVMDLERYYAERRSELSERTVMLHHMILSGALTAAAKNKIISKDHVARDVTNKPNAQSNDEDLLRNVWNREESKGFIAHVKEHCSTQYWTLFSLLLETGLRKGELLGLQWKDIEGTSLRVDRQLLGTSRDEDGKTKLVTAIPKGKRSRTMKLSQPLVALLRQHKSEQAELKLQNRLHYVDLGLVFAQSWEHKFGGHGVLGMPLTRTVIGTQLDRVCKAIGIKRITVHGLRHTSATLLLLRGESSNVVQKRLGHRSAVMTMDVYQHVLPSMEQDTADGLGADLHG